MISINHIFLNRLVKNKQGSYKSEEMLSYIINELLTFKKKKMHVSSSVVVC